MDAQVAQEEMSAKNAEIMALDVYVEQLQQTVQTLAEKADPANATTIVDAAIDASKVEWNKDHLH